jgi:hypothetical protein
MNKNMQHILARPPKNAKLCKNSLKDEIVQGKNTAHR